MRKTTPKSKAVLVTSLLSIFIFVKPALAWPPPCPGCCYWDGYTCWPDESACDACYSCVSCECEPDCQPGECCYGDTCVTSCPYGGCCNEGACVTTCPYGDCCNGTCCSAGEECCGGECCDPDDCCDDQECCDASETCCNGECCNNYSGICCDGQECCDWTIGEVCCDGKCCDADCCDSWDCEHCVSGTCEPCLEKASDYEELMQCSGAIVDDPDWTPQPNGCSSPSGNNPAWYACGEASSFLNACNAHDTCYQTCGSSKYNCDEQFSQNLAAVCAPFSGDCEDACDWWAETYVGAVVNWGLPYWKDGQVNACACCDC
jgi:hypothetical protein